MVVLALRIGDKQVRFACDSVEVANSFPSASRGAFCLLTLGTGSLGEDGGAELQRIDDKSNGIDWVPGKAVVGQPGEVTALTVLNGDSGNGGIAERSRKGNCWPVVIAARLKK